MADDILNPPAQEPGQGSEPQADPTPQNQEPTPEPQPEPEPQPAPSLTPEQIAEQAAEKAFQRIASWQGRRDKELFDNLGNIIDTKFRTIQPQSPAPLPNTPTDPVTLLENPDAWADAKLRAAVPRIFNEVIQQKTEQEQRYASDLIRHTGTIMDTDPLFSDKAFGEEVIKEIQGTIGGIDKSIHPSIAAKLLVNSAVTNVYRKKALSKVNPLAGNKPVAGPNGTVKPPAPAAAKPKPVKLSDEAKKLKERWGYSDEDLAKIFPEG